MKEIATGVFLMSVTREVTSVREQLREVDPELAKRLDDYDYVKGFIYITTVLFLNVFIHSYLGT